MATKLCKGTKKRGGAVSLTPEEERWSEPVFEIDSSVINKASIRCEPIQSRRYVGVNVIKGRRTAICRIYLQKKDKEIGLLDDKRVERL